MLLISLVGCHYLQVLGQFGMKAMCASTHYALHAVSLLRVPYDPLDSVTKVAHVLAAIDGTLKELKQHYSQSEVERKQSSNNWGPYFLTFDGCTLEYKQCMCENDFLYEAKLNSEGQEKEVVVKFVKSHYGKSVHQELANNDLAPKLIHHQIFPGGMLWSWR